MSKLLDIRIKDEILKNKKAPDFYIMSIISKDINNNDTKRLKDFKNFNKFLTKNKLQEDSIIKNMNYYLMNGIKIILSIFLIGRYRSFLVVPFFFGSYEILINTKNYFYSQKIGDASISDCCYFCQRHIYRNELNEKYNDNYEIIKEVLSRNEKINNLYDFENELDRIILLERNKVKI